MASEELTENAIFAAGEAFAAAEESPWGGVGYMMALSKWQPELYTETFQVMIKTVVSMFSQSGLLPPGLALISANSVLLELTEDRLPPRILGAKDALEMLDAILGDRDPAGMRTDQPDDYLVGFLIQLISCATALHHEADEREAAEKARLN